MVDKGVQKQFESYSIIYTSGGAESGPVVTITCWSGGKIVGSINFLRDDKKLFKNGMVKDAVTLHFPLSRFNDIINILRYEKPLDMRVFDSGYGYIYAGAAGGEPVGEQEPQ